MAEKELKDADLDKIFSKAFEDIRRKVGNLILKREKKLMKEFKISLKQLRREKGVCEKSEKVEKTEKGDKSEKTDKGDKHDKKKKVRRSDSSSGSSP